VKDRRRLSLLLVLGLAAAACSKGGTPAAGGSPSGGANSRFAAQMGSQDLWAGTPQRVQVGVFSSTQQNGVQLASFGQVGLAFSYLGPKGTTAAVAGPTATASYLGAPGTTASGTGPTLTDPATARGVYQAEGITFEHPGVWQVDVTADVAGFGTQHLSAAFPVGARPALPAPGQSALRTDNLTLASEGVPLSAIDSRALDGKPVPDPALHRWTIARALAEHRPILAVFATPTYCQSQFCGPSTDAVEGLAARYPDRAVFIHVEIWRDYAKSEVNKAAADWLYRNGEVTEPWLYLIGSDGVIKDRWGPLFDPNEVAKDLAALPPMTG
jgi:hypothetical protein